MQIPPRVINQTSYPVDSYNKSGGTVPGSGWLIPFDHLLPDDIQT